MCIRDRGVDFGLIDKSGRLLENPVHYRDSRTAGTLDYSKRFIDHNRLLQADVGVGHAAGDGHEAAEHEEQRGADADGDHGLDGRCV